MYADYGVDGNSASKYAREFLMNNDIQLEDEYTIYRLDWKQLSQETYLYGSLISFPEGAPAVFENTLMPPQRIVKSWFSESDYKYKRSEPSLPLLEETEKYNIRVMMKSVPEGSCFLRLIFYDQAGRSISYKNIQKAEEGFVYPIGAYSYELQIIQGGAERISFQAILLMEESVNDFLNAKIIYNPNPKSGSLNILLYDTYKRTNRIPDKDSLWNISNLLYAPLKLLYPENNVEFSLGVLERNWKKIRLLSYERSTEAAALYWESALPNGEAVLLRNKGELSDIKLRE